MNNKAIKTLLDKVKEFEDFFDEYEKEFYPKVIKIRNKFLISLIIFITLVVISYVLWVGDFGDLSIKVLCIIGTVVSLGYFFYLGRKFDKVSEGKPNKFEELCREVSHNLIHIYGGRARYAVELLIADLTDKQDNKIKKYESLVKSVGTVGMILVTSFITLVVKQFFDTGENSISFNVFIGSILLVFFIVFLITAADTFIRNIIKYPVFGKASKEVYLTDILYEVKYMILEKEDN